MDCSEAIKLFESLTKESVIQISRCGVGIANYVFIVSTATERVVLRCSTENDAYKDTIYWLKKLSICEIPIPTVLAQGKYKEYEYIILTYIEGDDIGNVYYGLSDQQKKIIAREVIQIQLKVSKIDISVDEGWSWSNIIDEMLNRSSERISKKSYFDVKKVDIVRDLKEELQEYISKVKPIPYLDDISTKNLLVKNGKLSGIIDIDWIGVGDMLTFVALTRIALLNMNQDTQYVDYLLSEFRPNEIEYKAFVFYSLICCVDFMGERGMQFLDKTIPVNEKIIGRLNDIFDFLMEEWKQICN